MKKHSLYTHLMVTSVTCSMLFLLVIATNTLTGYTLFSSPFDWKTEVREISRTEEYCEEFSSSAAIPDKPLASLSNYLVAKEISSTAYTSSDKRQEQCRLPLRIWHKRKIEKCSAWKEIKRNEQLSPWHTADLITFDLPNLAPFYPPSGFRLGGWKESNTLYKALNGPPLTANLN